MGKYSTDYAYIERAYGRHFEKGQRIRFDEDGRTGVVVKCRPSSAHYVNVVFDGEKHKSLCHPMSVTVLAATCPTPTVAALESDGVEQ